MTKQPKTTEHDARTFACRAHADQTDKAGRPYTEHLERVAARCQGDEQKQIAWLHDVLEDTSTKSGDLRHAGFHERTIVAVLILTRSPGEGYNEYITRIAGSGLNDAVAVKQADLADHLEVHPEAIPESLKKRYLRANRTLAAHRN